MSSNNPNPEASDGKMLRRKISKPPSNVVDPLHRFDKTVKWRTIQEEQDHDAQQMAYVEECKAEYERAIEAAQQGSSHQQHQQQELQDMEDDDLESDRDTITSLTSMRNRTRMRHMLQGYSAPSAKSSSVMDFERTSTVRPPTEFGAGGEEYTSNVNVSEIRREFFHNYRNNVHLPIYEYRTRVMNSINSYQVVIIEGNTGCGKTTQVPCYILEDAILDEKQTNAPVIYVTQPRKIAAKSIARRVCEEHNWPLGTLVGYQVGLDRVAGPQTILTYVTAGVLLQKLITEKTLNSYTHIVIDEAHERDSDTDLLLMMIRDLMRKEQLYFRLIIMSATMDTNKLKNYFTYSTKFGHKAVISPSICAIARSKKPEEVQTLYYDTMRNAFPNLIEQPPDFDDDLPEIFDQCIDAAVKIVTDIIPSFDNYNEETSGTTLVFLPGLAEITKLERLLRRYRDLDVIPLHSCLSSIDQQRIFEPTRKGMRKVILATNIAESSITVKDAGFIIDFCLTKSLMKDPVTRFPTLRLHWASKDRCIQRAGRTGRCCKGKVIRLVTQNFFKRFRDFAEPGLLVAPLELSVLRVKNFQLGEVRSMFALVLDPPPLDEVKTAVLELKQIGALSSTYKGQLHKLDGDMTQLGRIISALPIDVHLSKLIVMASVLDVLEDAIIVAACLSTNKSIVTNRFGGLADSYLTKLSWGQGSYSDLIVALEVYKRFVELKDIQQKETKYLEQFCWDNNFDYRKLCEVSALVEEIKSRLDDKNIRIVEQPNRVRDPCEDELMLKIAFCAAFYPNYFLSSRMEAAEIKKQLCGLDPTRTVILHGLPINQVPLFRTQVMNQLRDIVEDDEEIDYISDVSRALLVFNDGKAMAKDRKSHEAIGVEDVICEGKQMSRSVYLALKRGETGDRFYVREYRDTPAFNRLKWYNEQRSLIQARMPSRRMLPSWMKIVKGRPVDNRRLMENDEIEYERIFDEDPFIEVEFNEAQDQEDQEELARLQRSILAGKSLKDITSQIFGDDEKPLRGPTSPINLSFRSVLQKSMGFSVEVDPMSINSIILNPDYDKPRRQMLVGASVCQSRKGKILVRDTTLMPNIRGLPTLMALLFAQYYKLLYNENLKCIAGGVFGLGWDENDDPIDKNYEVEMGFDVQISSDDIGLINKCREIVSELIQFTNIQNPGRPQAELQKKFRQILLTLIRKRRFPVEEVDFFDIDWTKNDFSLDRHNVPDSQLRELDGDPTQVFLPIMVTSRTYKDLELLDAIKENLALLNRIDTSEEKISIGGVRCLLCGSGRGQLLVLRHKVTNHLNEDFHLQREQDFLKFDEMVRARVATEVVAA